MRKTITNFLALAFSLLCLLILGACPPGADDDPPDEGIGQVTITNIPSKVKNNDSFKIYIQLSASTDENDPHAAVGSGKIDGKTNVTLQLYKNQDMTEPWTVSGKYYVAVTISPQNAPSKDAIEAKILGISKVSTSEIKSIDWNKLQNIPAFANAKVDAIYDLIIKVDTDITTSQ